MSEVLVDTSSLIAFFVRTERHHSAAREYLKQHPGVGWIVLQTVFDETVTWIRTKVTIAASIEVGQVLRTEHRYVVLSAEDDTATWEAFQRYDDKSWSYTDCSLLVMARRLGVPYVFAFDRHFRQMANLGSSVCHRVCAIRLVAKLFQC